MVYMHFSSYYLGFQCDIILQKAFFMIFMDNTYDDTSFAGFFAE